MDFASSSIDLSLRNAETGRPLTASVYDVTLDNGTVRTMSVAQLVMAICLKRATEKEADVVAIMEDMARVTSNIEVVSDIEARLLELAPCPQRASALALVSAMRERTESRGSHFRADAPPVCS